MKLKQYYLGKWAGVYYAELLNGLSMVGVANALVNLTVLWAVASKDIVYWFSWLTYPIYVAIIFTIVLIVLPLFDYMLVNKTRQAFLNDQTWRHDNPIKNKLDAIEEKQKLIEKQLVMICEKLNIGK